MLRSFLLVVQTTQP